MQKKSPPLSSEEEPERERERERERKKNKRKERVEDDKKRTNVPLAPEFHCPIGYTSSAARMSTEFGNRTRVFVGCPICFFHFCLHGVPLFLATCPFVCCVAS